MASAQRMTAKTFDFAWGVSESNQFGTVDFIKLCRKVGAEPLICVNMGSGTAEEAMHWVEYCNGTLDTYYANLRRSHGYEEPFGVKFWGLGNEMYGPWQMENQTAAEYADSAVQFAKAMKAVDKSIRLVACGMEQDAEWNQHGGEAARSLYRPDFRPLLRPGLGGFRGCIGKI